MYIRSTTIRNLRCVERARIPLCYPGQLGPERRFPNLNVIVGLNGGGKSTVLRAIALGALAPSLVAGTGFQPRFLVRRRPKAEDEREAVLVAELRLGEEEGQDSARFETLTTKVKRSGRREVLRGETRAGPPWDRLGSPRSPGFFLVVVSRPGQLRRFLRDVQPCA
ncbi:MAG: AAA family ATPase [bacterium]|nr:AAA family ATPase [bacterium]